MQNNNSFNNLLIIDSYSFLFRSYYSFPKILNKNNQNVNAINGFFSMILNQIIQSKAGYIIFTLDSGKKTFRDEIYKEYKANRVKCPDDLIHQFLILRNGLESSGFNFLEIDGYEADDIIYTICSDNFLDVKKIICTKDKDLMQLVKDDEVEVFDSKLNKLIKEEDVLKKFCVPPSRIADYLSLIGDMSDNIPGAKNIGPKKAVEIIKKFESIDEIYSKIANNHEIDIDKKIIDLLIESKEMVLLSKKLVSLRKVDAKFKKIDDYKISNINLHSLYTFFDEQNIKITKDRYQKYFDNIKVEMKKEIEDRANNQMKKNTLSNQGELF